MNIKNTNNSKEVSVSVIVPLFHGAKYLDRIIQTIKNNMVFAKDIGMELVLVNDSPDDIPDFSILKSENVDIKTVINNTNLGIQRSKIRGMEHSTGEYLLFLDQDDEISDDAISKLINTSNLGDVIVSDWLDKLSDENAREHIFIPKQANLFDLSLNGNSIGPLGHCIIRRDCIPKCWKNKIMQTDGADDYLMWLGLIAEKRKFVHCKEKLYIHIYNEDSYSNDILKILDSENEAFSIASKKYGFSEILTIFHNRSIRLRKTMLKLERRNAHITWKRFVKFLYPERVLFSIWDKLHHY